MHRTKILNAKMIALFRVYPEKILNTQCTIDIECLRKMKQGKHLADFLGSIAIQNMKI